MKKILAALVLIATTSAFADTLCNVYCVVTLSQVGEPSKVLDITPTLYKSTNNNIMQVIGLELDNHCKKMSPKSRVIGSLNFNPTYGTVNVREIENTTFSAGEINCTNI